MSDHGCQPLLSMGGLERQQPAGSPVVKSGEGMSQGNSERAEAVPLQDNQFPDEKQLGWKRRNRCFALEVRGVGGRGAYKAKVLWCEGGCEGITTSAHA